MLSLAIMAAQILLTLSALCAIVRLWIGPHARDRVLALDAIYVVAILLLLTEAVRSGRTLFVEVAIVMAILGFASSVALAKFLRRGEVIE